MATVENMIDIAAPAEEVFDFVVDVRNEPRWNPQLLHVQMLTPEPVGAGTRFRVIFGRGVGEVVIEDTKVDRPRLWAAVSRSRVLDVESEGQILGAPGGSRLIIRTRLRPRGTLRLLTPALGWRMHRIWEHDLVRVKTLLEHETSTVSETESSAVESIERVPVPDLCALWAESSTTPMNIALIGVVEAEPLLDPDGTVALDRIRSFVEARLPAAPMLLRTLHPTHLGQGTPAWIDAPAFDIADHVILAPADRPLTDEDDFHSWCAGRSLIPLDRTRPLWRLDIIPKLPDRRIGVLLVLHHVVADGLRGVTLVTSLLESTPQGRVNGETWRPRPAPTSLDLVRDNLHRRWDVVRGFRPSRLVRSARTLRALYHAPGRQAPPTSLTGPIGDKRHLTVLRCPLTELRVAAHAHSCTINDLLIAAVTTGLRDMLIARGEDQDGRELLASVPVGARGGGGGGMFIAPLPVGIPDSA
ncbi:MAG TPA: wax ester/triacylglycerol synthase domain-containing protein, partial [Propionibacteriaceae bacterium]|nr:wax ester/triacylglycerol synthase domain-containing protein [Propionibacteriaceae bacterium]